MVCANSVHRATVPILLYHKETFFFFGVLPIRQHEIVHQLMEDIPMNDLITEFKELGLPSISLKLRKTDDGSQYFGEGSRADEVLIANDIGFSINVRAKGGDDRIIAGRGDDIIRGGAGDDYIYGFKGTDFLYRGAGDDRLYGQGGIDILYGGDGDDLLSGGRHSDYPSGGNGHDALIGGLGYDTLLGGEGNDLFLIGNKQLIGDKENEGDLDFVLDFTQGEDEIFVYGDNVVVAPMHFQNYDTPDAVIVRQGDYALLLENFTGQLTSADFALANEIEYAEVQYYV